MGRLIYGGTFDPIHTGHMRIAIEALEALKDRVEVLDFVPAAYPPHKQGAPLLPFALRVELILACIQDQPRMSCNTMEGERDGPSYTFDTLGIYQRLYAGEDLYFLLGSPDYQLLREWRKGLELPGLCRLVIVPRGNFSLMDFEKATCSLWPESSPPKALARNLHSMFLPCGEEVIYAPLHWLDISSSLVRKYWLAGHSVEYLMPAKALDLLNKVNNTALACWREAS